MDIYVLFILDVQVLPMSLCKVITRGGQEDILVGGECVYVSESMLVKCFLI